MPTPERLTEFDRLLQATLESLRIDRPETWSRRLAGFLVLDLHVLALVAAQPDSILREIRDRLEIPNSTLTSVVDRLEKRGLLRRVISPRDRRSYGLALTPAGRKVQTEHDRVHRRIAAQVLDALDEAEQQRLIDLLAKVQSTLTGR